MTIININNNKLNNDNDDDSQKTLVPAEMPKLATSSLEQKRLVKAIAKKSYPQAIYLHWKALASDNSLHPSKRPINIHRLKATTVKHLKAALKDYTVEEICESISNYAEILASDKHRLTYRWTLEQFIITADYLDLFLTENDPFSNPRWLDVDFSEEQKKERGLREAARNCLRTTPGCFSNSKKEVCVICRKYR